MTNPIRPTTDEARDTARTLMQQARYAALATLDGNGAPLVSRIAFGLDETGHPISLVSTLSTHTKALRNDPRASLLVGEPGPKGDPLTHPRLSLQGHVLFVEHDSPQYSEMATHYLRSHPKAKLYIAFADFVFLRLNLQSAFLNGGFGKAFNLTAKDLVT